MLEKRDSGTVSGGVSPAGASSGLGVNSSPPAGGVGNPPPNGSVTSPSGVAPDAVEPETLPIYLCYQIFLFFE